MPAGRDSGTADLIAGLAGGLFAPVATYLGMPFWLAIPLAILIFFAVRMLLAPRKLFEGFSFDELDQASLALAGEVLQAAHNELEALKAAAGAIRNAGVRQQLQHLHGIAAKVVEEVEKKPRRVNNVRRLLTYYLPSAVRLASGYQALEGLHAPSRERVLAAEKTIGQLDDVFTRYADRLTEQEVDGLDVEIKLLENEISGEKRA